jgi:hypothetical protein
MKTLLALLLLIPSLSWGLTFKDGEVINKSSTNNKEYEKKYLDPNYVFKPFEILKWIEDTGNWSILETHGSISQNPWNLNIETNIVRNGNILLDLKCEIVIVMEVIVRGEKERCYGKIRSDYFK